MEDVDFLVDYLAIISMKTSGTKDVIRTDVMYRRFAWVL